MALQDLATVEMVRNVINGTTPVQQAENAQSATSAGSAATATTANKVAHKLTITMGDTTEEFDGSEDKTIVISSEKKYIHNISFTTSYPGPYDAWYPGLRGNLILKTSDPYSYTTGAQIKNAILSCGGYVNFYGEIYAYRGDLHTYPCIYLNYEEGYDYVRAYSFIDSSISLPSHTPTVAAPAANVALMNYIEVYLDDSPRDNVSFTDTVTEE